MPKINRPHSIVVKVTADERDAITRLALKEKLTAANWLRSLGMAKVMSVPNPDYVSAIDDGVLVTFKSNGDVATVSDMGNPITESDPKVGDFPAELLQVEKMINTRLKDIQPQPPKPMPAEQRMYEVIMKRDGKAKADAWMRQRRMAKATPLPIEIGTPTIPVHLKPFYDSLVKSQGQAQADFWLVSQMSAKKISL